MELILNAKIRKQVGKELSFLRKSGKIPGVFYGFNVKNTPIELDYNEFEKVYNQAGENTVIKLNLDGAGDIENNNIFIQSVHKDPVSDRVSHIDLYAIRMDKNIRVEVPLVFDGVSEAAKNLGGIVVKHMSELEVEALPLRIPHEIKVDIGVLKGFDDIIRVKDIIAPDGVSIVNDPEVVIVAVEEPRVEEEVKTGEIKTEEESVGDVKVVGKEKGEEESDDAEEKKE
jgi:large subunit ribosomal protein L25